MASLSHDPAVTNSLADDYSRRVHAMHQRGVAADPEAQLTTPVDNLFTSLVGHTGHGELTMIREHQLEGSRPDFGALIDGRFCGFIELKKPGTDIADPSSWTGHNGRQWANLSQLDNLLLCNGREMRRFVLGEQAGDPAALPYSDPESWDPAPTIALLDRFVHGRVEPIVSVSALAKRLAPLARHLREALLRERTDRSAPGFDAARNAHDAWQQMLREDANEAEFADAVAQVVSYGLVIAALEGAPDIDGDGVLSLDEAKTALHAAHPLLSAALAPVLEISGFRDSLQVEIGAIERLVSALNVEAVHRRKDPRGEPWLWFYEDFLAAYDPEARKQSGVYYTPIEVVQCMTRLVDDILVNRFDKRLGFGDPSVTTLDPACGTGTFPLAVIDQAVERVVEERGNPGDPRAAEQMAAVSLSANLFGFEMLPGPYAVAHLRIGQRLRELGAGLPADGVGVMLADTLASPNGDESAQFALFGDQKVLARERRRAQKLKREQPITVVIGNPPYDRVARDAAGGWVLHGDAAADAPAADRERAAEKALFASVLKEATEYTIFSHVASLYNLYAYFWRWAMWKAFERSGPGPAVVAFITGSSWLTGPGFIGLRKLAMKHADEITVIDLGGDNKGAVKDENVFAIESPVAIVILTRDGSSDGRRKPVLRYRRIDGSRSEKLQHLLAVTPDSTGWVEESARADAFAPQAEGDWTRMPRLADLLPWQQPGCKYNRMWPVAPAPDLLRRRWRALCEEDDPKRRAELFVTAASGRNIHTQVGALTPLASLREGAAPEPIVRYGWRGFDRQWTLDDPRLCNLERPALWQSVSDAQVFLVAPASQPPGEGPCASIATGVPDLHAFMGFGGGKDVVPLFRDAEASTPNVTAGLRDFLAERFGASDVAAEDVIAYAYCVLATPRYQRRFRDELKTAGLRIPVTTDSALWEKAVRKGRWLIWLHTYAERFQEPAAGRGPRVPKVDGLYWNTSVTQIPATAQDIGYDASTRELIVGDGRVAGVDPQVWEYSISGMEVVKKWLGYRTAKGIGNAANKPKPLDRIRPTEWVDEWNDELLDLLRVLTLTVRQASEHAALLDEICDGPLISADELPQPTPEQRKVPKTVWRKRNDDAAQLTEPAP